MLTQERSAINSVQIAAIMDGRVDNLPFESAGELNEQLRRRYSADTWTKSGFEPLDTLNNLGLPVVEVAGPTYRGFKLVDLALRRVPMFSSNLPSFNPFSIIDGQNFKEKDLDFMADGRNLPFADGRVGGVAVSCLSPLARKGVIDEAMRVVTEGGLLIWQGGTDLDIAYALDIGLELCMYEVDISENDRDRWHAIFQKA